MSNCRSCGAPTSRSRENHPQWRGGRFITQYGYVRVLVGREHRLADSYGYAFEHVLVAEQKMGRPLLPGEVVHHRDGNKTNNDPSNLEVFASQAEHARHEMRVNPRMHKFPSGPRPKATHCPHGHEFTPENTRTKAWNGRTARECKTCHRERERARQRAQKASAA